MKAKFLVLGLAALSFASCQQYKKGEGGMLYKIHKDESGPTLKEGDFVSIKAVYKKENDSVMYSSYDFGQPTFMPMQKSQFKGDLFSALSLLSEGDSASFKLPVDSLVKRGMQPPPGKNKYVVYTFKIEKVIPKGKLSDQDFSTQVQAYINKERERMKNAEAGVIAKYIKDNNLKVETAASGMKYVVERKGSGPLAAKGDTVKANYSLYLTTSNKPFDTSLPDSAKMALQYNPTRKYEPVKFPVGAGGSIAGFEEALMSFPKGTKVKVILPSSLGYGEQGQPPIGPFTPLIFNLEILDVIKGSGATTQPAGPATAQAPTNPGK